MVVSFHHFVSALVHLIPSCGPSLASFWLALDFKGEIYSDAFHLKRSDTLCSYQQFESANHLKQKNNEDIKLSGTWEYLIKGADAESRVCCLEKLFGAWRDWVWFCFLCCLTECLFYYIIMKIHCSSGWPSMSDLFTITASDFCTFMYVVSIKGPCFTRIAL